VAVAVAMAMAIVRGAYQAKQLVYQVRCLRNLEDVDTLAPTDSGRRQGRESGALGH
jgi:hypothetical protein